MEHRYDEARGVLISFPEAAKNSELLKLSEQMDALELEVDSRTLAAPPLPDIPEASAATPNAQLPPKDSVSPVTDIHDFCQAARLQVSMHYDHIEPSIKDDNGRYMFSCSYHIHDKQFTPKFIDYSKKKARHKAAVAFIEKLWKVRSEAGTLSPSDISRKPRVVENDEKEQLSVVIPDYEDLGEVRALYNHTACPVSHLNNLKNQYPLDLREEYLQVAENEKKPQFQCKVYINSKELGVAIASKKKDAKKQAYGIAFSKLIQDTKGKKWKE